MATSAFRLGIRAVLSHTIFMPYLYYMCEEGLIKRLTEWKDNVENTDLRVNVNKTKVIDKWRTSEASAEGCKMVMWCMWQRCW